MRLFHLRGKNAAKRIFGPCQLVAATGASRMRQSRTPSIGALVDHTADKGSKKAAPFRRGRVGPKESVLCSGALPTPLEGLSDSHIAKRCVAGARRICEVSGVIVGPPSPEADAPSFSSAVDAPPARRRRAQRPHARIRAARASSADRRTADAHGAIDERRRTRSGGPSVIVAKRHRI